MLSRKQTCIKKEKEMLVISFPTGNYEYFFGNDQPRIFNIFKHIQ